MMFKILAVLAILAVAYAHPLTEEGQKDKEIIKEEPKPENLPALPERPESKGENDSEELSDQDIELKLTEIIKSINEKVDKNEELSDNDLENLGLAVLYTLLEEILKDLDSNESDKQAKDVQVPAIKSQDELNSSVITTEDSMIRPKRDTPECKLDNQPGVCVPYFRCDMILDGPVDDSVLEACPDAMDLCCPFEKLIAKEDIITPIVME